MSRMGSKAESWRLKVLSALVRTADMVRPNARRRVPLPPSLSFRDCGNRLICPLQGKSNPGIELRQINPTGKSLLIFRNRVKPRNQKYSAFAVGQISARTSAVLPTEGRAHVTNAERDAVDAAASGEQ
jgi:hypothetical protein